MEIFEEVYIFFFSQIWENLVLILKPTCFLAIGIFLWAIIWSLVKSPWLFWHITEDSKDFSQGAPVPTEEKSKKAWKKIEKKLDNRKEASWKLAVIEGADIVEDVLLKMGYKAKNLQARLLLADEAEIPNLKNLLSSVEIYNSIICDPDYNLTRDNAIKIIDCFEEFLKYANYL